VVNSKEAAPESELDVEMTDAFLLRADRIAGKVESGKSVGVAGVYSSGWDAALSDADGVLDAWISDG
jgi:hypothetical protein